MKRKISAKQGRADGMFYVNNPCIRGVKHFTAEVWVSTTIKSLLRFILGLRND